MIRAVRWVFCSRWRVKRLPEARTSQIPFELLPDLTRLMVSSRDCRFPRVPTRASGVKSDQRLASLSRKPTTGGCQRNTNSDNPINLFAVGQGGLAGVFGEETNDRSPHGYGGLSANPSNPVLLPSTVVEVSAYSSGRRIKAF